MSTRVHCDGGCGRSWTEFEEFRGPAVRGERADGLRGGGLPSEDFHWCVACAKVAFAAVADPDGQRERAAAVAEQRAAHARQARPQ